MAKKLLPHSQSLNWGMKTNDWHQVADRLQQQERGSQAAPVSGVYAKSHSLHDRVAEIVAKLSAASGVNAKDTK